MSSRDSLDEILEDHRVKWLNMLSELNDELTTVPEMLKVKAEIISEAKQAIRQWALDKQIELVKKLWAMERIPASQAKGGVSEEQSWTNRKVI